MAATSWMNKEIALRLPENVLQKRGLHHVYCQTGEEYIALRSVEKDMHKVWEMFLEEFRIYIQKNVRPDIINCLYWRVCPEIQFNPDDMLYAAYARFKLSSLPDLNEEEARAKYIESVNA